MGTLYVVSTPIGNLEDITLRAITTLLSVSVIACEDTRKTGLLLSEIKKRYPFVHNNFAGTNPKLISYTNENETLKLEEVLGIVEDDLDVALVSDAGTPLINDPGFPLMREAVKRGVRVVPIPGVNAAITAASASGLPANQILFLGFPPEKNTHCLLLLSDLKTFFGKNSVINPTVIFYIAPHKLLKFLDQLHGVLGNVPIVIGRELTKIHEEFWRGTVAEAKGYFNKPIGEFVILFHL